MSRARRWSARAIFGVALLFVDATFALADTGAARDPAAGASRIWTRESYDEYIRRFNAHDGTAFDDYIAPDMRMLNGTLELVGAQGMKEHYGKKIWPFFKEELHVERFVSDEKSLAVQMWAHFIATKDANTLFGPVRSGETFDFRGVIMYEITNNKFSRITVAYNSFMHTDLQGKAVNMGIPH